MLMKDIYLGYYYIDFKSQYLAISLQEMKLLGGGGGNKVFITFCQRKDSVGMVFKLFSPPPLTNDNIHIHE